MYHRPSRYLPGLERLEGRDLPSALVVQGQPSGEHQAAGPSLNLMVEVPAGTLTTAAAEPCRGGRARTAARLAQASRGQPVATPAWVNQAFLNSLAGQLYAPDHDDPVDQGRQPGLPAGHLHGPATDAGRDSPRDILGRVRRALLGRSAAVFQPIGHDSHFQQWPERDIESIPAGARPGPALPAGGSECEADDRGPGRRPGYGSDLALFREHPPVRVSTLRRGDQRAGRREQRSRRPRSRIAVAPGISDRPRRRFGWDVFHAPVHDDTPDHNRPGDRSRHFLSPAVRAERSRSIKGPESSTSNTSRIIASAQAHRSQAPSSCGCKD